MAKKPMTKSQIVSHFAEKFELTKRTSGMIIDEVAALAVSETKKTGSFTLPGIGKLVLSSPLGFSWIPILLYCYPDFNYHQNQFHQLPHTLHLLPPMQGDRSRLLLTNPVLLG